MSIKGALASGLAAVALAVGLAAMPQPASASTDGLPDGSWRQSCQKAYVSDGVLHARCRHDGNHEATSAVIGSCRAFGNRNGKLFCESPDGSDANIGQWSGSFRDSCREISVDKHGKLQATCRKNNGTYQRTNLQSFKCSAYRAGNRDGNLVCETGETGGSTASRWDGSFRNSCRDISTDAAGTLTATCQAANGSWRRTSLASRQCGSYRAGNRDGNLACESDDDYGQNSRQWDGSFSRSCREVSVDSNGTLTATCQTINGAWNRSSLSPRQCGSYQAGNRDGTLFCER